MTNPYPESNTPEEKLAEANAFSQGYYSPGVFEWWTEHPYRAWTLRHIMPYLDLYDSIKVLEPACGCGVNLANLHSRFPNCECTGVELSPQGVEVARECAPGDYRCGDAENLPVADESQDLVLCIAAVHHFRDPRRFLFECVRVLKPHGYLYLFEPHGAGLELTEEQEQRAEEVRESIRAANKGQPGPPSTGCVRAATEVPFDLEAVALSLQSLDMIPVETGHSEYLSEWARGYKVGWESAANFDMTLDGGTKFYGVYERRGT